MKRVFKILLLVFIGLIGGMGGSMRSLDPTEGNESQSN